VLEHGGRLLAAARQYGRPVDDWLDLSTGINPTAYPVPAIPPSAWRRLPEPEDGLLAAAAAYYGTDHLLPVAGSQQAIAWLPQLLRARHVAVLAPTYAEHAAAWQEAGCAVTRFAASELASMAEATDVADVVVVVNPNNPDGTRFAPTQLGEVAARMARRGGWLVVDAAFADAEPESRLDIAAANRHNPPGLIVLRSLGKFFGLAGARVGFVLAPQDILAALSRHVGPWPLAGPARFAATAALVDHAWQSAMRDSLAHASARLADLLAQHGLVSAGGCALFRWCPHPRAEAIAAALASRGILVRRFAAPAGLRFGLPGENGAWIRLAAALKEIASKA